MENWEVIELCNQGIIKRERVKNVIHYVCRAAIYEAELSGQPENVIAGLDRVYSQLIQFSAQNTHNIGVKAVTHNDSLLKYCFNQHNEIPVYIVFWLYYVYGNLFGSPAKYTERHYDVYSILQCKYIKYYRLVKAGDKEDVKYRKNIRRLICKMYRSGEYSKVFELYNVPLFDIVAEKELDNISLLFSELFEKELDLAVDDSQAAAIGYIVGRLQGLSAAVKTA